MLSREKAFADLVKPENLERIKIDPILIPYFVPVMHKIQAYFDKKGLMNANHYGLYLEKVLLGENPYRIFVSDEVEATNQGDFFPPTRSIRVNKNFFVNEQLQNVDLQDKLESLLCHEFIHLLVLADLPFIEQKDGSFKQDPNRHVHVGLTNIGFMNEAYTEYLTQILYPSSDSYQTEIAMMKLFEFVFQKEKDPYFAFLRGQFSGVTEQSVQLSSFLIHAMKYERETDQIRDFADAEKSKNYMGAIDDLMEQFKDDMKQQINTFGFQSVMEYVLRVAPLRDVLPIGLWKYSETFLNELNAYYVQKCTPIFNLSAGQQALMYNDLNRMMDLCNVLGNDGSNFYVFKDGDKVLRGYCLKDGVTIMNRFVLPFEQGKKVCIKNNEICDNVKKGFLFEVVGDNLFIFQNNKKVFETKLGAKHWHSGNAKAFAELDDLAKRYHIFTHESGHTVSRIVKQDKTIYSTLKLQVENSKKLLGDVQLFVSTDVYGKHKLWIEQGSLTFMQLEKTSSKNSSALNKQLLAFDKKTSHSVDVCFAGGQKFVVAMGGSEVPAIYACVDNKITPIPTKCVPLMMKDIPLTIRNIARTPIENLCTKTEKTFSQEEM